MYEHTERVYAPKHNNISYGINERFGIFWTRDGWIPKVVRRINLSAR